jgi:hypothetical protein
LVNHVVPMVETKAPTILLKFRFGHELGELRDHLLAMNHHPIWIAASNTIDVPAARGFVRSIRGELSAVELRFVAFHETWDAQAQKLIIHYISERCSSASDTEFFVDMDGDILVPRLISTGRLPQTAQSVDWDAYWIFEDSVLRLRPLPPVPTSWVLIKVDRTSTPMTTRFRAISGTIVHSGFGGWNSTPVITFTGEAHASYVLVQHYHVASCPGHVDVLQLVVPVAVLADTVGIVSLLDRERAKRYRILLFPIKISYFPQKPSPKQSNSYSAPCQRRTE